MREGGRWPPWLYGSIASLLISYEKMIFASCLCLPIFLFVVEIWVIGFHGHCSWVSGENSSHSIRCFYLISTARICFLPLSVLCIRLGADFWQSPHLTAQVFCLPTISSARFSITNHSSQVCGLQLCASPVLDRGWLRLQLWAPKCAISFICSCSI
jgi:hypothetical protein